MRFWVLFLIGEWCFLGFGGIQVNFLDFVIFVIAGSYVLDFTG